MQLSKGNKKMTNGFLIWNLPARKTCPGCTAICCKACYAMKAERMYPSVLPSRERNLIDSKKETFTKDMIQLIEKQIKGFKGFNGYFRIHESGDFYNQAYLDAWKSIAKHFPNVRFLAFTKSFDLNFKNVPKNMQIIMSIMPDTKKQPVKGFPKAFAGDCKNMGKTIDCPGSCDSCGMCWALNELKVNVHFNMH